MLKLSIECGNAAFEDMPGAEVARILRQVADKLEHASHGERLSGTCRDTNGNFAGEWSLDLEGDE
jgi:hypothetical protein